MSEEIEFVDQKLQPPAALRMVAIQSAAAKKLAAFYFALGLQISLQKTQNGEEFIVARCKGILLKLVPSGPSQVADRTSLAFIVDDLEKAIVAVEAQQGRVIMPAHPCPIGTQVILADPEDRQVIICRRNAVLPPKLPAMHIKSYDQCRREADCLREGATFLLAATAAYVLAIIANLALSRMIRENMIDVSLDTLFYSTTITGTCAVVLDMIGRYRSVESATGNYSLIYVAIIFDAMAIASPFLKRIFSDPWLILFAEFLGDFGVAATFCYLVFAYSIVKTWGDARLTERLSRMVLLFSVLSGMLLLITVLKILSRLNFEIQAFFVTLAIILVPYVLLCVITYVVTLFVLRHVRAPASIPGPI